MAVTSNLEYRLNYFVDAVVQPTITMVIELLLWSAIFRFRDATAPGGVNINGFGPDAYLAYALWAAFFARIAASWMYEFRMINDIESGALNTILARPVSFYEYYLSQLMGYKLITTIFSFLIPLGLSCFLPWPVDLTRLPLAILLVTYYLILVHSISFAITCFAFFLNKIHSFTVTKNFILWLLTGELFPLDLIPEPVRSFVIAMPFSSAVYIPVGYITGRIDTPMVINAFMSVTIGIVVVNVFGAWMWRKGISAYVGTGA